MILLYTFILNMNVKRSIHVKIAIKYFNQTFSCFKASRFDNVESCGWDFTN